MSLGHDNSIPSTRSPFDMVTSLGVPKKVEHDTRIELASYSFAQKDFDRTREHAERVLADVPGDPRALALIAACQILVGNLDAGITGLHQAIHGTAIEGYERAAEEAYEHLQFGDDQTVEISWRGFNECIQFLSQPDFGSDEDATAWLMALERARACVALERNDVPQGISDLKNHLRRFPQDVEARFELGRAYFHQKQLPIAAELFRQVLDVKPDHAFSISMLARLQALEADFFQAISLARQAFELNPQNCRSRLELVEYLYSQGDYKDALHILSDAPKCDCGWFRVLHARLECYRELGDFEQVLEVCEQMLDCTRQEVSEEIDLDIGQRVAAAHLVLATARLEEREKALMMLEQEADSFVVEKAFAFDTATLYRNFDEPELSRRLLECLSYELPYDDDVTFALAIAESEVGNFDAEKLILRQMLEIAPDHVAAYLRLSTTYERDSQFKESLYWAFLAKAASDANGRADFQIARLFMQLEATDVARRHLDLAITKNSSLRGQADADDVLGKLR